MSIIIDRCKAWCDDGTIEFAVEYEYSEESVGASRLGNVRVISYEFIRCLDPAVSDAQAKRILADYIADLEHPPEQLYDDIRTHATEY